MFRQLWYPVFRAQFHSFLALIVWGPTTAIATVQFVDTFEQPSVFEQRIGYTRNNLSGTVSAPSTSPALHINQGGDTELLYTEASFTHVVTLSSSSHGDVTIDGYVGFGRNSDFGSLGGGFVLRAAEESNYYMAHIVHNFGPHAAFYISESVQGTVTYDSILAWLPLPDFDPRNEDYRISFSATGDFLSASLWREKVIGDSAVEESLGTVSATTNGALRSGRVGLEAFARGGNHVFFDDITVSSISIPEPQSACLLTLALSLWRRTRSDSRHVLIGRRPGSL